MFWTRLMSSAILVVLALLFILTGGYLLAAVLLFLALMAFHELMKACKLTGKAGKTDRLEVIGYAGIIIYYLLMVFSKEREYLFLMLIVMLAAFMFLYVFAFPSYRAEQICFLSFIW